jgi:hypothetical protein
MLNIAGLIVHQIRRHCNRAGYSRAKTGVFRIIFQASSWHGKKSLAYLHRPMYNSI